MSSDSEHPNANLNVEEQQVKKARGRPKKQTTEPPPPPRPRGWPKGRPRRPEGSLPRPKPRSKQPEYIKEYGKAYYHAKQKGEYVCSTCEAVLGSDIALNKHRRNSRTCERTMLRNEIRLLADRIIQERLSRLQNSA
jgi:hypothetical protein